jgi:biopolymer transport protein ExbD
VKRRKIVEETEMDITPMIDVTFLLLIFFILTNNASKTTAVTLPVTRNNLPVNSKESVVLTIFKADKDPQVYLSNGKKENGPATLVEVTNYVREAVLREKRNVIILSDLEVPSGFVEEVALAASEASEEELRYYTGVLEKKQK